VTVYSVYEPSGEVADLAARAARLAFVKDGFSWLAFLVPALWLLYHRMWIELIAFLAVFSLLPWAFGLDRQSEELIGWISLALIALFAFEANDLRSAALERRGYRLAGVALGRDRTEAELSFFRDWLPRQEREARAAERAAERKRDGETPQPIARSEGEEVIGLFPRP
jgi:hypothetical protein